MNYYTSKEQSKKLLELGLNPNTADMFLASDVVICEPYITKTEFETLTPAYKGAIPCWSLGALLQVIPPITKHGMFGDEVCLPTLTKGVDENQWHCIYRSYGISITVSHWYDNPLDAVYDTVTWLLEKGYINK